MGKPIQSSPRNTPFGLPNEGNLVKPSGLTTSLFILLLTRTYLCLLITGRKDGRSRRINTFILFFPLFPILKWILRPSTFQLGIQLEFQKNLNARYSTRVLNSTMIYGINRF